MANILFEKGDKNVLDMKERGTGICTISKSILGKEEHRGLYCFVKFWIICQIVEDPWSVLEKESKDVNWARHEVKFVKPMNSQKKHEETVI